MKSTVMINGTLVGVLSCIEVDQPWFSALFLPIPAFDCFRALFSDLRQAQLDNKNEVVNYLNGETDRLHIQIVDADGRVIYSTRPQATSLRGMTCVCFDMQFDAGIMSWRGVDDEGAG